MYLSVCLLSQKSLQVNGTIFTYSVLAWIIFLRFSFQLTLVLVLNTLKKYMYIAYFNRFRIDLSFFQVVKTLSKWKPVHGVCEQLGASVLQSLIIKSALGAQSERARSNSAAASPTQVDPGDVLSKWSSWALLYSMQWFLQIGEVCFNYCFHHEDRKKKKKSRCNAEKSLGLSCLQIHFICNSKEPLCIHKHFYSLPMLVLYFLSFFFVFESMSKLCLLISMPEVPCALRSNTLFLLCELWPVK